MFKRGALEENNVRRQVPFVSAGRAEHKSSVPSGVCFKGGPLIAGASK